MLAVTSVFMSNDALVCGLTVAQVVGQANTWQGSSSTIA